MNEPFISKPCGRTREEAGHPGIARLDWPGVEIRLKAKGK
jgi:hypothetical protein